MILHAYFQQSTYKYFPLTIGDRKVANDNNDLIIQSILEMSESINHFCKISKSLNHMINDQQDQIRALHERVKELGG